jgi:hypothetical protein
MPPLFKRTIEVVVQDKNGVPLLTVTQLHVTFKAKLTIKGTEQSCEVTIDNLGKDSRDKLVDAVNSGMKILLKAGYETPGPIQIYRGAITGMTHSHQPPEWKTEIKSENDLEGLELCADKGDNKALSFEADTDKGSMLKQILEKAQGMFKLLADQSVMYTVLSHLQDKKVGKGATVAGSLPSVLDSFKSDGVGWFMEGGDTIVPFVYGKTTGDIEITADRIATPEKFNETDKIGDQTVRIIGWRLRTLLWPEVKLLNKVTVRDSITMAKMSCIVPIEIEHTGDTFDGSWETQVKAANCGG